MSYKENTTVNVFIFEKVTKNIIVCSEKKHIISHSFSC